MAVGDYFNTKVGTQQTLIESWNGSRWSIARSPNIGTLGNFLGGVSCVSAKSCTAVGAFVNTIVNNVGVTRTLIEQKGE